MDRKMNNPSWCCEKIQELIEEYKNKAENLYGVEHEIYSDIVGNYHKIICIF